MRRFNICTRKTYEKNGEEKAFWPNVGTLVEFDQTENNPDGGFALELNMFPDVKFYVFENKPKDQGQTPPKRMPKSKEEQDSIEYDDGEVNPEDIPFQ